MTHGSFLSRRSLLRQAGRAAGAASILGTCITATTAAAAGKVSKAAVSYQNSPNGDHRCGTCKQFVAPSACRMVNGTISPQGCCRIWLKA